MPVRRTVSHGLFGALGALAVALALGGCGMSTGNGLQGASGGSTWNSPNRTTSSGGEATPPPVMVPVLVVLRATAPADEDVRLDIGRIEIAGADQTVPLALRADLATHEVLPFVAGPKGATLFLARVQVPKKEYTEVRLFLTEEKSVAVREEKALPLGPLAFTAKAPKWTPDEKAVNVLTLTLDATKLTRGEKTAALPDGCFTASTALPAGSLVGKTAPILPTARVSIFLGGSKTALASAFPATQDGAFAFTNLPAGAYRVEVQSSGYTLAEPLKDLVTIGDKPVTLKPLVLIPDPR
jgi:hypothetical protein